ncbi:hypothetical protein [Microbacterium sp. cx-59]|uniref:hypothetical protein n=1 Tax=Microbacterium sp. cx-59 TaxID=2891207 RepID=UPI001E2EC797|nr:hypothetical protein [Microbacterium sp. cx-59]MCC4907501.1 hypothetical protein [Microbacterium sp. cx-59]
MILDPATSALIASVVVASAAVTFIATALAPRFASTGARLWGLAQVMALVSVFCHLVAGASAVAIEANWAVALGNGAVVVSIGCLLLGFRAYSGNEVQGPALMVVALGFLTVAACAIDAPGPREGGGEIVTYLSITVLSLGAAWHAVAGRTREYAMAWIFAGCLVVWSLFSLIRVAVVVFWGAEVLYQQWWGEVGTSLVLVSVGVVSTIAIFVLRATLAGESVVRAKTAASDDVLAPQAFVESLRGVLHRASARTELVVVIAVLVEDVGAITASFGRDVAEAATRILRSAVRAYASPVAIVGEGTDPNIVLVATTATSPADARRQAGLLYRGVVQSYVGQSRIVVPGVGVGVALSQTLGYAAETLEEGATIAAVLASESDETSVVFATVHSLPEDPFPADRV